MAMFSGRIEAETPLVLRRADGMDTTLSNLVDDSAVTSEAFEEGNYTVQVYGASEGEFVFLAKVPDPDDFDPAAYTERALRLWSWPRESGREITVEEDDNLMAWSDSGSPVGIVVKKYNRPGGVGGGGIRIVSELPEPTDGAIVYLEAPYFPSGNYEQSDFNIRLTPEVFALDSNVIGRIGGDGSLDPDIAGLTQVTTIVSSGSIVIRMGGSLLNEFGPGDLDFYINGEKVTITAQNGFYSTLDPPSLFQAGVPVTISLFRAGTNIGVTADGIRTLGDRKNPDEAALPEDFYHVSPRTGMWVRGLGGGTASGVPAAHLPQDNNVNLGLFIGLDNDTSGPDWLLDMRERNLVEVLPARQIPGATSGARIDLEIPSDFLRPSLGDQWSAWVQPGRAADVPTIAAAQATADLNILLGSNGATISVTMPTAHAVGAAGNGWTLQFGANDASLTGITIHVNNNARIISILRPSNAFTVGGCS